MDRCIKFLEKRSPAEYYISLKIRIAGYFSAALLMVALEKCAPTEVETAENPNPFIQGVGTDNTLRPS